MYCPTIANNVHASKIKAHFSTLQTKSLWLPPNATFLFICYTNRSGSNYLAELLASSGEYNLAGEALNWRTVITKSQRLELESFQDYFETTCRRAVKSHRVLMKVSMVHIDLLNRAGILQQIIGRSRFIVIERGDKLGQAISHCLAFATGRFTSRMESTTRPEEVEFSKQSVDRAVTTITEAYRDFDVFFARNGIVPIKVVYEQLTSDPSLFAGVAAAAAGMTGFTVAMDKLRLERQAGEVNQRWREQYLAAS